ncbi:RNA polymerase sigma factor [Cohnella nanjingensis]|uniref:Sigma-70 family RNA polymerase sigma factor n=1 Tax=Cohnella nanjingensis TaxID=1387779 RepID=A0A7X0RU51_9BACL|nr:sigma-70 family RNA polymerase sigma factor [Cohnella nanjingensis]MBB6672465.1 sigma-70 family RNA polymerase sigma factor [Cohnella nanjingensis]
MAHPSEAELMRLIRERRRDALEQLYDRYVRLVYSFANKATGDEGLSREIVQLVFTRLWTTHAEYDADKGQFASWIITITRNVSIDVLRRERRHRTNVPMDELVRTSGDAEANDPEAGAIRRLEYSEMRAAASRLSVAQQRVIDLLYWRGYTLQEIAAMGEEPIGTVKNRLHQALRMLRRHLQGMREEG